MNPYATYKSNKPVQSAREQEATALRLAARLLTEAGHGLERNRALNINHEMWSILFRELNSPACLLPEITKKDCIQLALWSMTYSTRAVLSDLPLSPLATLNMTVAEGLDTPTSQESVPTFAALSIPGSMSRPMPASMAGAAFA